MATLPIFPELEPHYLMQVTDSLAWWVESLPMLRETEVQSKDESYQRLKKMVLDTSLIPPQHYKVRIKAKVE